MFKRITFIAIVTLTAIAGFGQAQAKGTAQPALSVNPAYGNLPLYFIPNNGQHHPDARFHAKTPHYTLWMTSKGLVFENFLRDQGSGVRGKDKHRLAFIGTAKHPVIVPIGQTNHRVNYYIGRDASQWHTGIRASKAVLYQNLYPGIDLKIYGKTKQIEYDWIVKPNAHPSTIRFKYEGVQNTHIDPKGNLMITTVSGPMSHQKPVAFQVVGGEKVPVDVMFQRVGKDRYGFKTGPYDRRRELIIDPVVLVYSTYLGGGDTDMGTAITVDSEGRAYITGRTRSTDFPVKNAVLTDFDGERSIAFVSVLNPRGDGLIYSTFLGGSDHDSAYGIAVDSAANAYVTGKTKSSDFPVLNAYQDSPAGDYNPEDAFISKFSADGTLVYSTYLGGGSQEIGYGLAVDGTGCAYVCGDTTSSDFPVVSAVQGSFNEGVYDGFVTKLSPDGGNLVYSTYLGGSDLDQSRGIAVDAGGAAYVTGRTKSLDFPIFDAFQNILAGGYDAFVVKLAGDGQNFYYSTYLGGTDNDGAYGIAVDDTGCAWVTGRTYSTDFPLYGELHGYRRGSEAFAAKLSPHSGQLPFSTYLGGLGYDEGCAVALDNDGNAYITGVTGSADFPVHDAFQRENHLKGVFVTKLSRYDSRMIYSTYLGGGDNEEGLGIATDGSGNAYVMGGTSSSDFPLKQPFQSNKSIGYEGFVSKLTLKNPSPFIITAPYHGSLVNGGIDIVALAANNASITRVVFYIDGQYKHTSELSPFTYTWDTTAYAPGPHTIRAVARTASGKEHELEITVTVNQLPTVHITAPVDGAALKGTVLIQGTASDDFYTPVTYLYINDEITASFRSETFEYTWETRHSGAFVIKAEAKDHMEQKASEELNVTVENIILTLRASRQETRSLFMRTEFGRVTFDVENPGGLPVERYVVLRKKETGNYYMVKEFPAAQVQGSVSFNDFFLEQGKAYTYKVDAVDPDNYVVASSDEVTI